MAFLLFNLFSSPECCVLFLKSMIHVLQSDWNLLFSVRFHLSSVNAQPSIFNIFLELRWVVGIKCKISHFQSNNEAISVKFLRGHGRILDSWTWNEKKSLWTGTELMYAVPLVDFVGKVIIFRSFGKSLMSFLSEKAILIDFLEDVYNSHLLVLFDGWKDRLPPLRKIVLTWCKP